jgi:hypothetical protein
MQINFFILYALPEAFDKDVVAPGSFPVHADPNTMLLQQVDKVFAGELTDLVGIEDFRGAVGLNRGLDRLEAERFTPGSERAWR